MKSDPPLATCRPIMTLLLVFLSSGLFISAAAPQQSDSEPEQDTLPISEAMKLNRAGRWEEAAQLARRFLDTAAAASPEERCAAFYHYAYASSLLGHKEAATEAVAAFDRDCAALPEGHWLRREIERVRAGHYKTATQFAQTARTEQLREEDGFWQTVDPNATKNAAALAAHLDLCERSGADACLVVQERKIVQEWYSPRYGYPMYAMSSTKSITGLLVGMLVDDGKLESIDEPVCSFVEEWCAGDKGKVTVKHLLSQTSGLRRMYDDGIASATNKNPFVIGLPLTHEPGTRWDYSNEGVQLLSPVLDRIAGEPIQDYARRKLFEPLGMANTRLKLDRAGHAWTYADMLTTPRDLARIGVMMLDKGTWQGRRIVGQPWVRRSTVPSQPFNERYGLLWWLYDEPAGFAAIGYLDTNLYVFPRLDLVVVRMQSKPSDRAAPGYEQTALPLFKRIAPPG